MLKVHHKRQAKHKKSISEQLPYCVGLKEEKRKQQHTTPAQKHERTPSDSANPITVNKKRGFGPQVDGRKSPEATTANPSARPGADH